MFKFTLAQIVVIALFSIISIFSVNYFAEVNRLVLLIGVYPILTFTALAIIAWCECE